MLTSNHLICVCLEHVREVAAKTFGLSIRIVFLYESGSQRGLWLEWVSCAA